jgi:hypothetical protein
MVGLPPACIAAATAVAANWQLQPGPLGQGCGSLSVAIRQLFGIIAGCTCFFKAFHSAVAAYLLLRQLGDESPQFVRRQAGQ